MKYAGKHTYMRHEAYACSYEATAESNEGKDVVETPRQEGESCRGVGQRGWESYGVIGGCRRCGSQGLGWSGGVDSLRLRSGGSHVPWQSVLASG